VAPDGTVTRPARLSGVEEHPLGEELLVYDPRSETAYALGQFVGLSGAALLPDVIQGVTRLHESGLLEFR
jgi:hypothetical protein